MWITIALAVATVAALGALAALVIYLFDGRDQEPPEEQISTEY